MSSSSNGLEDFSGAKVIVTGASGFIGAHLIKKLVEMNARVMVIDRMQPTQQFPSVEFEWADLRHLNKIYEADYLIHLAAVSNAGYAEQFPLDTYETNVLGTLNLLQHVQVAKRILFPSTALIYQASEFPINEDSELEVSSTYAQSKIIGEQVVRFHCDRMGIKHTIVRFFNIFGPGQLPLYIVPQVVKQIIDDRKVVLRNGSVVRDLLYVDDCTDAVLKLAVSAQAVDTVFNIGSSRETTIMDVAKAAVQASEYKDVEIVDLQQEIQYSPAAIIADTSKIRTTVDWHPRTSLEAGLKGMMEASKVSNL